MAPGQTLNLQGIVSSRWEAGSMLRAPGDAVLVERVRPRLLLLSCPCGCGEEFPINLDPRAGPAWRVYRRPASATYMHQNRVRETVSLFPSVWRESGCRSHYVIWNSRILLFGRDEDGFVAADQDIAQLAEAVHPRLPIGGLTPVLPIADALGAIPWDVLAACRRLVRAGRAREGIDKQQGWFGRR
jgi:hypothetical protein